MGLRSWILKPYLDKLEALEAQVREVDKKLNSLRTEILELHKNKADKERLHLIEKEMESVENLGLRFSKEPSQKGQNRGWPFVSNS